MLNRVLVSRFHECTVHLELGNMDALAYYMASSKCDHHVQGLPDLPHQFPLVSSTIQPLLLVLASLPERSCQGSANRGGRTPILTGKVSRDSM